MKKLMFVSLTAALALAGTGCAGSRSTRTSYLGYWDNSVKPLKTGSASDMTLTTAMKNGNIEKIHHCDVEETTRWRWFFWLWDFTSHSRELVVYGE